MLGSNSENTPLEYPFFEIIAVDGLTEVIEHRSYSTVFYVVDDPAVKRAIGAQ
jgi:hypothetical protein